jgi:hypothetical protein
MNHQEESPSSTQEQDGSPMNIEKRSAELTFEHGWEHAVKCCEMTGKDVSPIYLRGAELGRKHRREMEEAAKEEPRE